MLWNPSKLSSVATILSLSLLILKKNIFLLFLLYSVRLSLSLFFSLSSLFSVHLFVFSSFHRFSLSHRWIVMVVDRGLRISVVVNRGPFSLLFLVSVDPAVGDRGSWVTVFLCVTLILWVTVF